EQQPAGFRYGSTNSRRLLVAHRHRQRDAPVGPVKYEVGAVLGQVLEVVRQPLACIGLHGCSGHFEHRRGVIEHGAPPNWRREDDVPRAVLIGADEEIVLAGLERLSLNGHRTAEGEGGRFVCAGTPYLSPRDELPEYRAALHAWPTVVKIHCGRPDGLRHGRVWARTRPAIVTLRVRRTCTQE